MCAKRIKFMALFRGFPRQKYSSSFNVKKKKSNSEIILLGCVLLNQIQKLYFSCAFYFGIPIVGLWLVLRLGMGLGLGLGLRLGLGLG